MPPHTRFAGVAVATSLLLFSCQSEKIDNTVIGPGGPVSFAQDIEPLLTTACAGSGCHVGETTSGVNLSNYQQIINSLGDQYGERIVDPGNAADSPIVDKISTQLPRFGERMPLGGTPLSGTQIAQIRDWIDGGALDN